MCGFIWEKGDQVLSPKSFNRHGIQIRDTSILCISANKYH